MIQFFNSIGEIISNIFGFFQGLIDGFTSFVSSVQSWWDFALSVLSFFPDSVLVFLAAAVGIVIAFIIIEILRDLL